MTALRAGIDIGGTKIEIAVLDPGDAIVLRERVPMQRDYSETLAAISGLIRKVEGELGTAFDRIGVGSPGSLSPRTGLIRNAPATCLDGHPFDRDLADATGCLIRLENDANCFALAEATSGAARDANVVFGVILGTGVGGGITIGRQLHIGANRIAGEWGHTPLSVADGTDPPTCLCGRNGCVEAWCSGPALSRDHALETGMDVPPDMIAALAASGDGQAAATLERHLSRLARALSTVVNILDPDTIVLGGGLSNLPGLAQNLQTAVRPHVFSDMFQTPIRKNELGDSAGVIGAAALWPLETP